MIERFKTLMRMDREIVTLSIDYWNYREDGADEKARASKRAANDLIREYNVYRPWFMLKLKEIP